MTDYGSIDQSPSQTLKYSSVCPPPPAARPPSRAVHQSGHTSHRLACNHFPPLGISLHTSHSRKPGRSHARTGALSVWLHWFYRVLEAQQKQRTLPFAGWSPRCRRCLPAARHLPAGKHICLSVAVSWADRYSLLKSPTLPGAGSAPCCLFQSAGPGAAARGTPPAQPSLSLSTCIPLGSSVAACCCRCSHCSGVRCSPTTLGSRTTLGAQVWNLEG